MLLIDRFLRSSSFNNSFYKYTTPIDSFNVLERHSNVIIGGVIDDDG